MNPISTVYYTR